jgi:putative DNA primase/helicase
MTSHAAIPKELLDHGQWIAWWAVIGTDKRVRLPSGGLTGRLKVQEKPHKLPINPHTGGLASVTKKATWGNCQEAVQAAERWSLSGVGFVFTDDDPFTGVDLDKCRDQETGVISKWARQIIDELNSYTEVSPSGTGVKITIRGNLPKGFRNRKSVEIGQIEFYSRVRYFTYTAQHLEGTPTGIEDRHQELLKVHARIFRATKGSTMPTPEGLSDAARRSDGELIERATSATDGEKFQRLWSGEWASKYNSQSEADMALCCILAYWTDNNAARIDSLFRQSALMREKWERQDYRQRTIEAAVARTRGPKARRARITEVEMESGVAPDLLSFPHTDTGNAERLVAMFGNDIRFCPELKKWLAWDGRRWSCGDVRHVKRLFKKTIREMYRQAADVQDKRQREEAERHARKSESANAINAALACAECEEQIFVSSGDLDQNPFFLNVLNGILDLRTGRLSEHNRAYLITKLVKAKYRANADCPQFKTFLNRILTPGHDSEVCTSPAGLIGYVQKCFGSACTGDVSDKAVFCLFGTGNNGKTTLLEAIRHILAEYSTQVMIDSLMAHQGRESSGSLADLADLRGARFVTTSETEQGSRLAVGKLKYLTQGMGKIKTCRKYENPIQFEATHKLFLDANHTPEIRGAEKAVWNRLKPIPFLVTIAPEEIDKHLLEKLKAEAEGILTWLVAGCLRWQHEGLGDPPEVTEAAITWRAESDRFPVFLQEKCLLTGRGWVPISQLWRAYQQWCEENREQGRLAKPAFEEELQKRGCHKSVRESGTVRVWIGIALRADDFAIPASAVTK